MMSLFNIPNLISLQIYIYVWESFYTPFFRRMYTASCKAEFLYSIYILSNKNHWCSFKYNQALVTNLCLGQTELICQLHPLWSGQISLGLEPFLQSIQLLVTEHGARLPAPAVFSGAIVLVYRRQGKAWNKSNSHYNQTISHILFPLYRGMRTCN